MNLWPGYWKVKALADPILFEIPKKNMKELLESSPAKKIKTLSGNIYAYGPEAGFRYANGAAVMEDFGAGETIFWAFPLDNEVHIILKGKAEVTYSLEGTNHTEEKKMIVEEGDIYLIPRGARMTWRIDPNGPLRKLCIVMPAWGQPERRPEAVEELK